MKFLLTIVTLTLLVGCSSGPPPKAWIVRANTDQVTGVQSCAVVAPDYSQSIGGDTWYTTSIGSLYPFVEKRSDVGLIVGVVSGGRAKIPPGDIVWRVDQNPPRYLSVNNTPSFGPQPQESDFSNLTAEQRSAIEASQAMISGLMSSIQQGVTAVSGEEAQEMLQEMKSGTALLFRAAAAPASGGSVALAGQWREDGTLRPIPLGSDFAVALSECGVV